MNSRRYNVSRCGIDILRDATAGAFLSLLTLTELHAVAGLAIGETAELRSCVGDCGNCERDPSEELLRITRIPYDD